MNYIEQYKVLDKNKKELSREIWKYNLGAIWEHFRNMENVNIHNLEKNGQRILGVYLAPLRSVRDGNLVCWPVQATDGNIYFQIFIDENYYKEHQNIALHQLVHEFLHVLSDYKGNDQYIFGKLYEGSDEYLGINEAVTQMFTEDVTNKRLGPEEDYLYFIKNIMRVLKVVIGPDLLANQYLGNNNEFEQQMKYTTNYRYDSFVVIINTVYKLCKKERYGKLTEEEKKYLEITKKQLLHFTSDLTIALSKINYEKIEKVKAELQDEYFIGLLNLDSPGVNNMFV